jgi:hypothetical protein
MCDNRVKMLVPTKFDYKEIEVQCNSAAFDSDGAVPINGRYCEEHVALARTDLRCGACWAGGFRSEADVREHYRIDCSWQV